MWGYLILGVVIGVTVAALVLYVVTLVQEVHDATEDVENLRDRMNALNNMYLTLRAHVNKLQHDEWKRMNAQKEVNELRVQNTPHNEEDRQEKGE